jgi:hypothetical protein
MALDAQKIASLCKANGLQIFTVVIPDGATGLSNVVALFGRGIVGIMMPADWTAADLTLQGSHDDVTYHNVYDASDNEVTIQAAEDRFIVVDPSTYAGLAYVKFRSGTAAVPVDQNADRTLRVMVRDLMGR